MPTYSIDFFSQLMFSPLTWVASSILLYIVGSHLAQLLKNLARSSTWLLASLQRSLLGVTGEMVLRLAYFVGLPYLGLILGVVGPRTMGLVDVDWTISILNGIGLGLVAFVAIASCLGYYAYNTRDFARHEQRGLATEMANLQVPFGWSILLVNVVCQEAHWAFYRASLILLLHDVYAGSVIGLGLVLLELYTNPQHRYGLTQAGQAEGILLSIACAILSTLTYLLTGNLWACAIIHLGITVGATALARRLYGGWGEGQLRGWRPWRFTARAAADTRRRG